MNPYALQIVSETKIDDLHAEAASAHGVVMLGSKSLTNQSIGRSAHNQHIGQYLPFIHVTQAVFSSIGLVIFALSAVMTGSILVTRLAAATDSSFHSDPFAAYTVVLPGQPATALADFGCQLIETRVNGQPFAGGSSCAFFPTDDVFDVVHVESVNGCIAETTFYAIHMKLGDMILRWGRYAISAAPRKIAEINWQADNFSIEVVATPYQYTEPIRRITFTIKMGIGNVVSSIASGFRTIRLTSLILYIPDVPHSLPKQPAGNWLMRLIPANPLQQNRSSVS